MAKSKKTAPALPKALQGYEKHPVYALLELHESNTRALLKAKGARGSLEKLMEKYDTETPIGKLTRILWRAQKVRDCIEQGDTVSAALFMYRMAVAVDRAGCSLQATGREPIDRRWLDKSIRDAIRERPTANRTALWTFFRVEHNGPDNPLEVEGSGFIGDVFWQTEEVDGCLVFDDGDKGDSVNFDTFKKAVSKIKK